MFLSEFDINQNRNVPLVTSDGCCDKLLYSHAINHLLIFIPNMLEGGQILLVLPKGKIWDIDNLNPILLKHCDVDIIFKCYLYICVIVFYPSFTLRKQNCDYIST